MSPLPPPGTDGFDEDGPILDLDDSIRSYYAAKSLGHLVGGSRLEHSSKGTPVSDKPRNGPSYAASSNGGSSRGGSPDGERERQSRAAGAETTPTTGYYPSARRAAQLAAAAAIAAAAAAPAYVILPIVVPPASMKLTKKKVAHDISKLLANNRAYVQHTRTPPVASIATLQRVSRPKYFGSDHPDAQRPAEDPTDYAEYKTQALRERREVREAAEAVEEVDKAKQLQDLAAWQAYHVARKADEVAAQVVVTRAKDKLGLALSRHVNARARNETEASSRHQGELKRFADQVHKEALAQFG